MRSHRYLLLATAAAVLASNPAWAQDAAKADQAEAPAAQSAEGESKPDDIIVTADRREQNLQNYGGTAAVLSGEDLKKTGIISLAGLNDSLPGVTVSNINNQLEIYIRGIGTNNNTELGDPGTATHFDGIYIPRTAGLGPAFFDVRSVEVNYGPQGTLRGRNSTGGSVNVISYAPKLNTFEGQLGAGYGNFDHIDSFGFINVPIGNRAAVRVSGSFNSHGAYYRNVGPIPSTLAPEQADDRGVRAQLLFKPISRLSINVAGDYNSQTGTGYTGTNFSSFLGVEGGLINQANQIRDPRAVITGPVSPFDRTEHYGIRGKIRWEGDGLISAEYNGSYRVLNRRFGGAQPQAPFYPDFVADLDRANPSRALALAAALADDYSQFLTLSGSNSIYQEFRLFSDTAPLVYSLGGNYFHEDQRTYLASVADNNAFFQGNEFNTRTQSDAFAFFGDATYSVTPRFRLTGGIRYTDDRKSRTGIAARYGLALGAVDFNCCAGIRLGTPGFQFNGFGRTNFNPDANNNGTITNQEIVNFYLDGIRSFGSRDTFLPAFSNAIAAYNAGNPNSTAGGPGCFNSPRFTFFTCAPNGNYTFAVPFSDQIFQQQGQVRSSFVDWRVRGEYDLGEDHLVYALVSRGHKSAGFNDNLGNLGIAPTYRPESVTLFEVGTKNKFLIGGRQAIFNASLFYNRYKDQQLTALLSVDQALTAAAAAGQAGQLPANSSGNLVVSYTFNAADNQIYGAQVDGSVILPAGFKLGLNALWLEANVVNADPIEDFRFQRDVNSVDSVPRSINGNRLPRTSRWQVNGSVAQAIPAARFGGTFDWLFQVAWRSSSFQTIFNSVDFRFPNAPRAFLDDRLSGYVTFNAAAGLSSGRYRFEAYVNNLTDQTHAAALLVSQFANSRFYTNPRIYGARFRVGF